MIASFVPNRDHGEEDGRIRSIVKSIDHWLATHPAARLSAIFVGAITIAATLFTLYSANIELDEMAAERAFRQQERVDRDRRLLFTRAGGDTGKADVFNRLMADGLIGPSIDLSCRNLGTMAEGRCVSPPAFSGLSIIGPTDGWGDDYADYAFDLNFAGAQLNEARMDMLEVIADLSRTQVGFSRIERSSLEGRFDNVQFTRSSLAGSSLSGSIAGASFEDVNISGAGFWLDTVPYSQQVDAPIICSDAETAVVVDEPGREACLAGELLPQRFNTWFWADRPPTFYPDWQVYADWWMRPVICDPRDLPEEVTDEDIFDRQLGFCEPMSMATALFLYPLRWNQRVRCTDRYDLEYLKTERTAPPAPCIVMKEDVSGG